MSKIWMQPLLNNSTQLGAPSVAALKVALDEARTKFLRSKHVFEAAQVESDTLDQLDKPLRSILTLLEDENNQKNLFGDRLYEEPEDLIAAIIRDLIDLRAWAADAHESGERGQAKRRRRDLIVLVRVLAQHWKNWGHPIQESWNRGGFGDFVSKVVNVIEPSSVGQVRTAVRHVVTRNK